MDEDEVDDSVDEDEAVDEVRKQTSGRGVFVDGKSDVVGSSRLAGDCGTLAQADTDRPSP